MLFDAILKNASVYSRIYSGDILLHKLCEQIGEVKRTGSISSISKSIDKDQFVTLLVELVESIKKGIIRFLKKICIG